MSEKKYTHLNSFLKAFNGPPLALMIFKPVINLLNGKMLFILMEINPFAKNFSFISILGWPGNFYQSSFYQCQAIRCLFFFFFFFALNWTDNFHNNIIIKNVVKCAENKRRMKRFLKIIIYYLLLFTYCRIDVKESQNKWNFVKIYSDRWRRINIWKLQLTDNCLLSAR